MASAISLTTKPEAAHHNRDSRALSPVLALLALSVFINYVDRSNLSIAAPMLKDELGMSAYQLGLLLSSFFWTYSLFLILSGWLVDRVSVSWVMAIGFFLWSAATSATGFLHGFTALMVVRLVLGIGESVAYPAYSKDTGKVFPGLSTRIREFDHRVRTGLRSRLRHVARRHADVPVWVAVLLCSPRFHHSGLACALVSLDATGTGDRRRDETRA